MRAVTPIPHLRREETVGIRRAELGIRAVRTETRITLKPGRATSGLPRPFILRVEVSTLSI
jgi:hypothetical protein